MANKSVFKSASKGTTAPPADTTNRAGGIAYKLDAKAALAQYAATGTFHDTFYAKAGDQVDDVLRIAKECSSEFIAKVAMYSRESGRMKDMPALLCALLSAGGEEGLKYLKLVFPHVIDNGKMLRNYVQIIRSGKVGRKNFGTAPKKLARAWFDSKPPEAIFKMSIGNDPSLADVIKMIRPKDLGSPERKAFYAYLLDKEHDFESLPPLVKQYEKFKKGEGELPRLPWEMATGLPLTDKDWKKLAEVATWTQVRMNLNTFARHGVFKDEAMVKLVADKLKNGELIQKASPFPYQIYMAYLHTETTGAEAVPAKIRNALHDAMELSMNNIPTVEGNVYVGVDVSGSMHGAAVTGNRGTASSKARCLDVAALIGCSFLRKNKESMILPFDTSLHLGHKLDPNDSVLNNSKKLATYGGGGTQVSLVVQHLNKIKAKGDLVIIVSDNESWVDSSPASIYGRGATSSAIGWDEYKKRNPKAKMVCINLTVSEAVQVKNDIGVLNIGGFSDTVWDVIKSFVEGMPSADHWVKVIEAVQLPVKV